MSEEDPLDREQQAGPPDLEDAADPVEPPAEEGGDEAPSAAEATRAALRELPQVEQLLQRLAAEPGVADRPRPVVARELRLALDLLRSRILSGELGAREVAAWFEGPGFPAHMRQRLSSPPYHIGVINATGVVLHTGLGRAPLSPEAREALLAGAGYCRLEVDAVTGERSRREDAVRDLLLRITGAESALVVNNNAAATLLALNTLAVGREVCVSRGEMVEIGGSYRMPEVMRSAGCRLVDVGCTNRTYARDYRAAVTERTGLFLRVHTSNYRINGFTERPSLAELVALGRELEIPVVDDLGSGQLWPEGIPGLEDEPRVQDAVAAGAALVLFSGDKLLGGCQAGILVGQRSAVDACHRNPLYRAVRCGKLSLIALEATLRIYASAERVPDRIPTLGLLLLPLEELRRKARRLKAAIDRKHLPGLGTFLMDGASRAGSGSAPDRDLPTRLVALKAPCPAEHLVRRLRAGPIPVFARVSGETVLLDPRTIDDEEAALVAEAVAGALQEPAAPTGSE